MTRTLIDQFSKLVRNHVESIVLMLHEAGLGIGPSLPKDSLLGEFESSSPFSSHFQVDTHLRDFEGKKYIFSPSYACASPIETSISMDTSKDALIIRGLPLTLAYL